MISGDGATRWEANARSPGKKVILELPFYLVSPRTHLSEPTGRFHRIDLHRAPVGNVRSKHAAEHGREQGEQGVAEQQKGILVRSARDLQRTRL